MAQLNEYKCPKCGGALRFDANTNQIVCDYCDSFFDPAVFFDSDLSLGENDSDDDGFIENVANTWADGETDGLYTYICKSCSGEIVGDETMAATSCPYCGNPVVISGAFTGKLRPDLVIPFKLDKDQAVRSFSEHLKGKALLPKVFKNENKIKEIRGIYVPFWIFDTDTCGNYKYTTTTSRSWSDKYYDYKTTSYYKVIRYGQLSYKGIPVNSAYKIDDRMMESLEPFYLNEAVPFQTAYLAGYFADKFDVDTKISWERSKERVANTSGAFFMNTVKGYETVNQDSGEVIFEDASAKYALFPIWLLSAEWNGNIYRFAMNGQTGKFVGDLPMDGKAYALWMFLLTLGFSALAFLISFLLFN